MDKSGIKIDVKGLEKALGCTIVKTSALKGTGVQEAVKAAVAEASRKKTVQAKACFSAKVEAAVSAVEEILPAGILQEQRRWYAIKVLERDSKVLEELKLPASAKSKADAVIADLEKRDGRRYGIYHQPTRMTE